MRASELLGDHLTDALAARLRPVVAEEVVVRPLPSWAGPLLSRWVAAITLPWGVYVRRDVLSDLPRLAPLLVHELVHVRQWKDHRVVGFLRSYIGDYLRGRLTGLNHTEAYRRICLEQEAIRIAGA